MFTHLYIRSGFSLMGSTVKIEKLAALAKSMEYQALALTDDAVLHGAIPFVKACRREGLKPIIGMTVSAVIEGRQEHIILLAQNMPGYQALIELSTHIQLSEETPDVKELSRYAKELIGILPVHETHLPSMLLEDHFDQLEAYLKAWQACFAPGAFYLGVEARLMQNERLMKTLKAFADYTQIPPAALKEVRYLEKNDAESYQCLRAMAGGQTFGGNQAQALSMHFAPPTEMEHAFAAWPEAIKGTETITERCNVEIEFDRHMLPSYPVENGKTAHAFLRELCEERLLEKYGEENRAAKDRMNYELGIIEQMNFSDYFLIVWDFVAYAKSRQIMVGPGRGSAAGSLVAYLLGITEIDPLKHQLLFERFLNPERVTMPDIDIDFSDLRRDEVIDYVQQKYGRDHVAQIITFGTFAARSLIRELVKTLQIDEQDMYFILREMSKHGSLPILEYARVSKDLQSYISQSEPLRKLFRIAAKLEGLPRHISTHAAGVVISEEPLVRHVPLTKGSGDIYLTQFPMNDLEAVGLLKMDFLGLRNLTMIERILDSIRFTDRTDISLASLPEQDAKTFQLLQEGRTNGIFQLESAGMKRVLRELKPTSFADIVAVNALYRPGPMEYIPTFVKRKHGLEPISYPHPDLEPILKETYGVLVYQEQIMQIAHQIAGFSLGQADILRRAVSKKKKAAIDEQKEAFLKGCLSKGYSREVANQIFDWIVRFSNYGFNKSHAVAYSKIAYQLAYLKANYPAHFFAELMTSASGHHDKLSSYVKEAKHLGLSVRPPSVNKSLGFFTAEAGHIRMGLNAIKGIGHQAAIEIIRARKEGGPFKDLFEFCRRVDLKLLNRAAMEALIMAGAFDAIYSNRASMLASIDGAIEQGELFGGFEGQESLFQDELEANYIEMEDFSQVKKLQDEKDLLGIYISSHPLKNYRPRLEASGFVPLSRTGQHIGKRNMKTCAIIQSLKVIRTKRGDPMAFITLSDETEEAEAVMFPELYRNTNRFLEEEMIIFAKGKIEQRNDTAQWILEEVSPFAEDALKEAPGKIYVKLAENRSEQEALGFLKSLAARFPGDAPVILHHAEQKKTYQLQRAYALEKNEEVLKELRRYFGEKEAVFSER